MNTQQIISRAEQLSEIETKMIRVHQFLDEQNLSGIILTEVNNFAWITAGLGDNHILLGSETGVASLLILRNGRKYILANDIEMPHLLDEDVMGLGYEPVSLGAWWNAKSISEMATKLAGNLPIGSDTSMDGIKNVKAAFNKIRWVLTPSEIKKYRWLCRQSAEAVVNVCNSLTIGQTEQHIEAMASDELMKRGIRPTVILIGSDERLQKYFHYPPQEKKIKHHVFVNVCAKRWGMIASVGRYVYFGTPPQELVKAHQVSAEIAARLEAASKPGALASDLVAKVQDWYKQMGYENGWQKTHLGGGIGYAEREWFANPSSTEVIQSNTAMAWNPFTPAALSFDTVLVTENGVENLTYLPDFPAIQVEIEGKIFYKPGILVRAE